VTEELTWPERPTCHDGNWHAGRFAEQKGYNTYREPRLPDPTGKYGHWSRPTCWYCGSISPKAFHELLHTGGDIGLELADMKYGWPHKVYLRRMPLPDDWQGLERVVSTEWVDGEQTVTRREVMTSDWGKFYFEHLKDLREHPLAFGWLTSLIRSRLGLHFVLDDAGRLMWGWAG
jgi:hypothetical protein